jgi:hypothetical protein
MTENYKGQVKTLVWLFLVVALLLSTAVSACRKGPDLEAQYGGLVNDLSASLVDFTAFDLASSVEGRQAPRELAVRRDRFRTALLELQEMSPPSEFKKFHVDTLPLYDQVLQGMDIIVEAATENDRAKAFSGRILLAEATEAISGTLKED